MTGSQKTNTLQGYPAYKNTSISWLGLAPEHWKTRRIKTVFRESQERRGQKPFELLSMTRAKGLIPQSQSNTATLLAEDLSNYKVCRDSDIVMNRMQAWSGMFAVPQQEGVVSPDYSVFTPTEPGKIRFFEHLFKTPILVEQFAKYSKGIGSGFNRLYSEDFGDVKVPVPPPEEQAAIVRFLDHADEQIKRYIAGKERLITLLEEERQALVHQAVTRGLDPRVRLKSSGVEWLGEVPEHWEVTRARFLLKEVDKRSSTGQETHLSMSQVLGLVPSNQVEQTLISDSYVGGKLCDRGDLVLNRLKAHLGVFALASQPGVISPDYSVFRQRVPLEIKYVERVFRLPALRTELRIRSKGIVEGFWRLYSGDLFDIRLPVPPYGEQSTIVNHLNDSTARLNISIERSRRQIDLMNEYRTRLIADVVTGQLDVREAAAQLGQAPTS